MLSTWAGYPAPAVVGALLVRAAGTGWAPTVLGVGALVLLVSLVRVRSWYTALVMVALTAATAALWWWVGGALQAAVLLGVGLFLLVGAWRHLGALLGSRSPGSDAAVLAGLTRVPRWCWSSASPSSSAWRPGSRSPRSGRSRAWPERRALTGTVTTPGTRHG